MFFGVITSVCLLGGGFIAFWCSYSRVMWPLMVMSVLMAVISLQLLDAYLGDGRFHDLSAYRAMNATVVPGLVGTIAGLVLARLRGRVLIWRSWRVAVIVLALIVVLGALIAAQLI